MNRPQSDLVPRRAQQRRDRPSDWLRWLALLISVCLASFAMANDDIDSVEEPEDTVELTEEEDEPDLEPVGRAQLIPVDPAEFDPPDADTESDESLIWPERSFLRISATQDLPFLVPLPDPPLVPSLPPVPFPPAAEPVPEDLPVPLAPSGDSFCPECQNGFDDAMPPGSMLIHADEDSFGIGSRQVPFALFHIDSVEPLSQIRLRADFANGLKTPDRAERFWAAPPVGPSQPEREVNYQTFSVYSETGGDHFAAFTEIPLIFMNADVNGDTLGPGNITIGQKFLLTNPNNRHWQIAQILRTYLPTGSSSRGLGNGLTAIEPGLLFRYRRSERTYFHGEIKYWIPFGGDPKHAGQVVQYGTGMSHVLWQTDERAVMSTLELIGWTIGDGQATLPDGTVQQVNGDTFFSILPGLRTALGPSGDLGLFEVGVSSGLTFGDAGWYDTRFLFDFRWSY
ncbi:MAG TPA: hypothetical protein VFG20_22855 [Planctomycetaceae bacterium]|nr:hypothetical protein [Planctomycetaceae bacterium]